MTTSTRLRPPRNLVSPRARWHWTVRAVPGWIAVLAAEVVWATAADRRTPAVIALVVTVIVAAAHLVVMPLWRFRVHRWEATNEAVYTQAGWLHQERRIAPVSRIQTVDTARGLLQQLFGLATVTVTTASAAGPLKINGLDQDVARELVDELTVTTQAHQGDAT